ncbi:MAG: hypothetical protein OER88_14475, partial [Planctomycetota bacterium]|nr:hypothetical protein [Planctomycetota bacterium]
MGARPGTGVSGVAIRVPGSKSLTQRYLVQAFWTDPVACPDGVRLDGALDGDDPNALCGILTGLGATVARNADGLTVHPTDVPRGHGKTFFGGNAGTAVRFGAALSLGVPGAYAIDGDARMRTRPWGPLLDALEQAGVIVERGDDPACPPAVFHGPGSPGPSLSIEGTRSSQFASALLLTAPAVGGGLTLSLDPDRVSEPYLRMTLATMEQGGVAVDGTNDCVHVPPGRYRSAHYAVEPDASAAAFPLAAGRLLQREVSVPGLLDERASLQGDAAFTRLAQALAGGATSLDLTDVPDLLPPLAVLALAQPQRTTLAGIAHTRIKECDRPAVLAAGFRALGANVEERHDALTLGRWTPADAPERARLATESDHRMAMAFGLLRPWLPGLSIDDPACVTKSFPDFWNAMRPLLGDSTHG